MAQDVAQTSTEDATGRVRSFAVQLPTAAEVVIVSGHSVLPLRAHELSTAVAPILAPDVEYDRLQARLRTLAAYVDGFHETDAELRAEREAHASVLAELRVCEASAQALTEERDALSEQLAQMGATIASLESASAANGSASEQYAVEVQKLTEERDALSEEVRRMRQELVWNEESLQTLQKQVDEEQKYISELLAKLDSMSATTPMLPPEPAVVPEPPPERPQEPERAPPFQPPEPERTPTIDPPAEPALPPIGDPKLPNVIAEEDPASANTIAEQVYSFVREAGEMGATAGEVADALGMRRHTVAARMHYLAKAKRVTENGQKRGTARGGAKVFIAMEASQ